MPIQLLDLSDELLEQIALNLSTLHNYQLALTCKRLAPIASGRPLYQRINLCIHGPPKRSVCNLLYDRLEEAPQLGNCVRFYSLRISELSTGAAPHDISHRAIADLKLAFLLITRMPRIVELDLPYIKDSFSQSDFVSECVVLATRATSLKHVYADGSDHRLPFETILPFFQLPALASITLYDFQLGDVANHSTESQHFGHAITHLDIGAIQFTSNDSATMFRSLLVAFPNTQHLRLAYMDGIGTEVILPNIIEIHPRLTALEFEGTFCEGQDLGCEDDWLRHFPALKEFTPSGACLNDSTLFYLSPTATLVNLAECDLPIAAQAYAITRWIRDATIKERRTVILPKHDTAVIESIKADCDGSLIDIRLA